MKDSHGYAPVHYAAKFNRPEILRKLVEGGAGMSLIDLSSFNQHIANYYRY